MLRCALRAEGLVARPSMDDVGLQLFNAAVVSGLLLGFLLSIFRGRS